MAANFGPDDLPEEFFIPNDGRSPSCTPERDGNQSDEPEYDMEAFTGKRRVYDEAERTWERQYCVRWANDQHTNEAFSPTWEPLNILRNVSPFTFKTNNRA